MRKISSAASCVCATCTVKVPGRVIVLRKNLAATHVEIPICLAFSTMFFGPHLNSNSLWAALLSSFTSRPCLSRTRSKLAASTSR